MNLQQALGMFPKRGEPLAVRGNYDAETWALAGQLIADALRMRADDVKILLGVIHEAAASATVGSEYSLIPTAKLVNLREVARKLWASPSLVMQTAPLR